MTDTLAGETSKFDVTEQLGVAAKTGASAFPQAANVIKHQEKRPPVDLMASKIVIPFQGTAGLGIPIRWIIPRQPGFVPSKHALVRIELAASATGPTTPSIVQGYNMITAAGNSGQLFYNNQEMEKTRPSQLSYESKFHQSSEEKFLSQVLQNEGAIATRRTNNTANVSNYILLAKQLSTHIHKPLDSYPSFWTYELNLDVTNKIVQGASATAASTLSIARADLILHGHTVPRSVVLESQKRIMAGLEHFGHEVTEISTVIALGKQTPTFTFDNLRGNVSHVVWYGLDNAKFNSTVPNVLDKESYIDLGEGTVEIGTTTETSKFTGRPQELRAIRYNKGDRESGPIYLDFEGVVKDLPFYTHSFAQTEEIDIVSGKSSGSVMFDGTEQISLNLRAVPSPNVEIRYVFLFYRPTAYMIKGDQRSKKIAK